MLLVAYARERLTPGRVLPAVLLVLAAVVAGSGWPGRKPFALDAALALALVVSFRILDDLMDRERDRVRHPDRVLVRAKSTAPLRHLAFLLVIIPLVTLWRVGGPPPVALLVAYMIVLTMAYTWRGPRSAVADRILLLKYGVFALVLMDVAAASSLRGQFAAAAAFVAACVYEWWHDAESPVFDLGGSR
jgi:4-hydroxybenzoate polyprenyltransferase